MNEYRVAEFCWFTAPEAEAYTVAVFSPSGPLLHIERYMRLPTGMTLAEALTQAESKFGSLGEAKNLITGPTLDTSRCDLLFGSTKSDCAAFIPPVNPKVYGVEWPRDASNSDWTLTITESNAPRERPPEFPPDLSTGRLLYIHWRNYTAESANGRAVSKDMETQIESSRNKRLKF